MNADSDYTCGLIDHTLLEEHSPIHAGASRSEKLMLALIAQQRQQIDRCLMAVDPERVAVVIGSTAGGMAEAEGSRKPGHQFGPEYDFRFQRLSTPARFVAKELNACGLVTGVSTACTSGARAIGLGMRWLELGWCDLAIVGGADVMCDTTVKGFASLEALSEGYCKPFDQHRDGINLGEGGALLVLSSRQADKKNVVEVAGYGESMDAWHLSAPHPQGNGIATAMQDALSMAMCTPENIGYINMHGTATPHNDVMEAWAVLRVLGSKVPVSSTKPMTGHTLAGAGALEATICYALAKGDLGGLPVQHGMLLQDPQIDDLKVILRDETMLQRRAIMSNSCGFGGHNTSLVLTS
ncbi:MAG: beta-ketoacyl-[acyl-carrier-protein] synthase II [marine bacterium B5-7]|nr:MAG: beta-ketoacyl-[acyl-carrier-protein] synthase II [marine bacterium B5-7]